MNKLELAKNIKIDELKKAISRYIYAHYKKEEQDADKTARETATNRLLMINNTYTVEQLYIKVGEYALNLLNGIMTVQDVINMIPLNELQYWEKLIKIGVRLAWIEMCIIKYKQLKVQIIKATDVDQILALDADQMVASFPPYPQNILTDLELSVMTALGL